ncbi:MAG: diphthine synthase, partial [Candidatus Woesearchaeota archaeon]
MTLYMVGIGLSDEKDISVKGLEAVRSSDHVYLESYTSILQVPVSRLEEFYGRKVTRAGRDLVENKAEQMLDRAKDSDVAFLVAGDPMSATTHIDLMLRAEKKGIKLKVIHNASVLNAVGITGLQLYKFGKTASMPFPHNVRSQTPYDILKVNMKNNMHTLMLLDLEPEN